MRLIENKEKEDKLKLKSTLLSGAALLELQSKSHVNISPKKINKPTKVSPLHQGSNSDIFAPKSTIKRVSTIKFNFAEEKQA